jgi:hypothetical protein
MAFNPEENGFIVRFAPDTKKQGLASDFLSSANSLVGLDRQPRNLIKARSGIIIKKVAIIPSGD